MRSFNYSKLKDYQWDSEVFGLNVIEYEICFKEEVVTRVGYGIFIENILEHDN